METVADMLREAAINAWLAGARAVHEEWANATDEDRVYLTRDENPDFAEAAHDYAADLPAIEDGAERMREALRRIAIGEVPGDPNHGTSMYNVARKMALAALAPPVMMEA